MAASVRLWPLFLDRRFASPHGVDSNYPRLFSHNEPSLLRRFAMALARGARTIAAVAEHFGNPPGASRMATWGKAA